MQTTIDAPVVSLAGCAAFYHGVVIRSLRLEAWAGRWVAVDGDGRVVADAESVSDLLRDLRDNGIEGVEIMRAPDPQQPATYGLG
jgi:hypothetical protein